MVVENRVEKLRAGRDAHTVVGLASLDSSNSMFCICFALHVFALGIVVILRSSKWWIAGVCGGGVGCR